MTKINLLLILLLLLGQAPAQGEPLVVGMKESAPFTMKNSAGEWEGISAELWSWIAKDLNLEYRIEERDLSGLLSGVSNHDLDMVVGALTITKEREELFDFSNSFYNTGFSIAISKKSKGFLGILKSLWSPQFLKVLFYLLLGLFIMTVLVWFFEKTHADNPRNKHSHAQGLGWSFWWAIITLIGYDDEQPRSAGGRFLAVIWMIASVIGVSVLTAVLTTVLTVNSLENSIKGPEDLARADGPTATIEGSSSAEYLEREQIPFKYYPSIHDALQAVVDKEADGFLYDDAIIRYNVKKDFQNSLTTVGLFETQNYAFALPSGSPHREEINRAILKFTSEPRWRELLNNYLGN